MKEFKCKKCKRSVALTDGKYLYAGGMAFSFKTTGTCLHCGQVNCWRPLHGKKIVRLIEYGEGLPKLIGIQDA